MKITHQLGVGCVQGLVEYVVWGGPGIVKWMRNSEHGPMFLYFCIRSSRYVHLIYLINIFASDCHCDRWWGLRHRNIGQVWRPTGKLYLCRTGDAGTPGRVSFLKWYLKAGININLKLVPSGRLTKKWPDKYSSFS